MSVPKELTGPIVLPLRVGCNSDVRFSENTHDQRRGVRFSCPTRSRDPGT